jgi:hypothetical protein
VRGQVDGPDSYAPAELVERDTPLGDEPPHVPLTHLNSGRRLLDGQNLIHCG